MTRYCSPQFSVRTRSSPPYRATIRPNVFHGRNSINCAKRVLPVFTGASLENFQRMLRVQIADTPFCSETGGIRGFQSRDPSVNRTAVKRIKRVPVMREGKIVGIISRANIVRAVGATKGTTSPEGEGDDRSIRARLLAELGREEWAQVWPEDIIVRDGIVHFWISEDEPSEKRHALRVAAETITGVRGIEEHVVPAPVVPAF